MGGKVALDAVHGAAVAFEQGRGGGGEEEGRRGVNATVWSSPPVIKVEPSQPQLRTAPAWDRGRVEPSGGIRADAAELPLARVLPGAQSFWPIQ